LPKLFVFGVDNLMCCGRKSADKQTRQLKCN